jgi:hypothetical protein
MRVGCKPYEDNPMPVQHKGTPAEPFAQPNQRGLVTRVAPGGNHQPQMAYVVWDGEEKTWFGTWERTSDLKRV